MLDVEIDHRSIQVEAFGKPDILADIRALPFRHSLDAISTSALERIPDEDIIVALKSCRAALRPGGRFEARVQDLPWLMRKFLHSSAGERWAFYRPLIFGAEERGQHHRTGFSVKRLSDCLVAAGFRTIKVGRRKCEDGAGLMEINAVATV